MTRLSNTRQRRVGFWDCSIYTTNCQILTFRSWCEDIVWSLNATLLGLALVCRSTSSIGKRRVDVCTIWSRVVASFRLPPRARLGGMRSSCPFDASATLSLLWVQLPSSQWSFLPPGQMFPHSLCHGFVHTPWWLAEPWTDWSCHPHYALSWTPSGNQLASFWFQRLGLNPKYHCRTMSASPRSFPQSTKNLGKHLCKSRVLGLPRPPSWMQSDAPCTRTRTLLSGSFIGSIDWIFHCPPPGPSLLQMSSL